MPPVLILPAAIVPEPVAAKVTLPVPLTMLDADAELRETAVPVPRTEIPPLLLVIVSLMLIVPAALLLVMVTEPVLKPLLTAPMLNAAASELTEILPLDALLVAIRPPMVLAVFARVMPCVADAVSVPATSTSEPANCVIEPAAAVTVKLLAAGVMVLEPKTILFLSRIMLVPAPMTDRVPKSLLALTAVTPPSVESRVCVPRAVTAVVKLMASRVRILTLLVALSVTPPAATPNEPKRPSVASPTDSVKVVPVVLLVSSVKKLVA